MTRFEVVVVNHITPYALEQLAGHGAVGLLVPGAGATTDRAYALASLVRGATANAYLHGAVRGRPRIRVTFAEHAPLRPDEIVVALPRNRQLGPNDRRYPIAIVGEDYRGLLTSPTTRIPGLVAIKDILPTALGHLRGRLGAIPSRAPLERLARLNGQIHANNRLKLPTLIIIACTLLLIALVRPRLAVPSILAALLSSLALGALHATSEPLIVAAMFIGMLVGGAVIARLSATENRLLTAIVLVLAAHVLLLVLRPEWVAVTPLGPTQNSRFWGIGNQLETLLLTPVLVGAAIAARRYGLLGLGIFATLALVIVTDNRLGSDGGGAIVFGIALAFLGARTKRLGASGFVTLLLLAATTVLAVISLNLRMPGPDHLRSAFSHGLSGLADVAVNRVPLAYVPAVQHWQLVVPLAAVFLAAFAAAVRASDRRSRDLVVAAGLAIATSLLVNDSAFYELAGGIAVVASLARFTTTVAPSPRLVLARAPRPAPSED